jgi:hypothetical protein
MPHRSLTMKPFSICSCALVLLLLATASWAEGTLTHLSGSVFVDRADGKSLPATAGTQVAAGETVATGANAYARLEMTDGSEIVLRPDSRLKVEDYKFNDSKPQEDSFVLRVFKGGLRTVSGLIGKRGNRDAYEMKTPTATIGIRGTQWDTRVCDNDCGRLPPGTYVSVRFGAVHTANGFGGLDVGAGHAAHVPPSGPPVMLPRDPGAGFTPPPEIPKLDERKKRPSSSAEGRTSVAGDAGPQSGSGESCAVE